jgi:hypothetical protein
VIILFVGIIAVRYLLSPLRRAIVIALMQQVGTQTTSLLTAMAAGWPLHYRCRTR